MESQPPAFEPVRESWGGADVVFVSCLKELFSVCVLTGTKGNTET